MSYLLFLTLSFGIRHPSLSLQCTVIKLNAEKNLIKMLASAFAVYDSLNETGCCVEGLLVGWLFWGFFPCCVLQQIECIIEVWVVFLMKDMRTESC